MKLNRAGALTLCLAAGAALAGFLFVREQRRAGELESSLAGARQQLQAAEGERARIEEETGGCTIRLSPRAYSQRRPRRR